MILQWCKVVENLSPWILLIWVCTTTFSICINLSRSESWSQLSAPFLCLTNISWYKAITHFIQKPLQWDIPVAEVPLPNLPPFQKRLKHLSDSKPHRGAEKVKPKVSLLTPCSAEVQQVQEDTYSQRLFHSFSVVLVEHPPHIPCLGVPQIA